LPVSSGIYKNALKSKSAIARIIYTYYNKDIKEGNMKIYSSKEIIKMLEKDGWHLKRIIGSHHHFKHPSKPGKVTVPHPRKDLKPGTAKSIFKQAGFK
jgi:predicted RNA binding protein YcfA (HicA-like mRNA interferase family)